ncbi:Antibiotic biosynthesis monooxygenase [Polaromonas sp. JS666]|nr:Antibiotic biosynthesis monooxygenase [Polaromonas sp. JS666]
MIVSLKVKSEYLEEFLNSLNEVLDAMRLETTFVNTIACRSPDDPNSFLLFETWLNREHFMTTELKRAYRVPHEERLGYMLLEKRELAFWTPIRGDFSFGNGWMQGTPR